MSISMHTLFGKVFFDCMFQLIALYTKEPPVYQCAYCKGMNRFGIIFSLQLLNLLPDYSCPAHKYR